MKMKKLVVTMFAAGVMTSPLVYATDGYFSDGYGMKSKGMGGVGIALPQDSLAAANNPAGMVMVGNRMDVGVDLFQPTRTAEVSGAGGLGNGTFGGNDRGLFLIPEFGYNKMIDPDKSLGVSVYGNGGMNTSYTSSPFGPDAGINLQQLFIAPTFAMKINDSNAIGISLNLVYQTFSATGLLPMFSGSSTNAAALSNNGTDSSTGVGMRIGWTGQVSETVTLGATYQPKTSMSNFNKYAGLFAGQGSFDIPGSYGAGIAVKASDATIVSVDYKVIQYSGVPAVANPVPGGALGAANGMGFGWQDVKVIKLGVSHALSDTFTVRAGYSHNTQPIPASQTMFNILAPGVVQDHVTLGTTWDVTKTNQLTLAYMHAFQQNVNGVGAIPLGFGGGNANIKMFQDSLGIAYSWKL